MAPTRVITTAPTMVSVMDDQLIKIAGIYMRKNNACVAQNPIMYLSILRFNPSPAPSMRGQTTKTNSSIRTALITDKTIME